MPTVVGVQFKPVTKIYYFDPAGHNDLKPGDWVVVDTTRGREVAQVVQPAHEVPQEEIAGPLKGIVRRATPWDMIQRDQYMHREAEALQQCRQRVTEYGLPMKVVRTEYNFDGGRLVVYFTSEERIDFRALVRDLARLFRTRIEMKQIGVRDEAKMLDGIGKCGRRLCCSSWLREFNPVSIKMAKQQDLPLNPSDISGVCGRLLCCLDYEMNVYAEARQRLPKVGAEVITPEGSGRVRQVHTLKEMVTVRLEDGTFIELPATDLVVGQGRGSGRGCGSCEGCSITHPRDHEDEQDDKPESHP